MCGCSRRPSTCSPTWACSRRRFRRAWCRPALDRFDRAISTITSPRPAPAGGRHAVTITRHGDRRRRRRGRRRRGLDRRRPTWHPRDGPRELELQLDADGGRRGHDPEPGGRRQRQPPGITRQRGVTVGQGGGTPELPLLDLERCRNAGSRTTVDDNSAVASWAFDSVRRSTATSRPSRHACSWRSRPSESGCRTTAGRRCRD